ncbi:MAG: T9SS type A sorting domain-containing protein [Bacteroidales bacterium]|jgi:hypothetical protein|nr:T9SS type A sorting domain-containing protein [Bacteroidales bacterium]
MMKQYFLSIIVICVFCLTFLPLHAVSVYGFSIREDSTGQSNRLIADAQANKPFVLQNSTEKKLKAYPNPISRGALLTIEIPDYRSEMTVFLYNTVGKVIQTFKTSDKKVEFNAPDISGIYLLRFVEKQKVVAVEKIVVKE